MESMVRELQEKLQSIINELAQLSSLAKKGSESLVERFLTEAIHVDDSKESKLQTQLYVASFWGIDDIVKQIIEQEGVNINAQNKETLWTPLHAAAFQEQGKVVMMLLQKGADPEINDFEGRSPKDLASASTIIWPHFANLGLSKTPQKTLVEMGIMKEDNKSEHLLSSNEPDWKVNYGLRMDDDLLWNNDEEMNKAAAALSGDVLAAEDARAAGDKKINFNVWK